MGTLAYLAGPRELNRACNTSSLLILVEEIFRLTSRALSLTEILRKIVFVYPSYMVALVRGFFGHMVWPDRPDHNFARVPETGRWPERLSGRSLCGQCLRVAIRGRPSLILLEEFFW